MQNEKEVENRVILGDEVEVEVRIRSLGDRWGYPNVVIDKTRQFVVREGGGYSTGLVLREKRRVRRMPARSPVKGSRQTMRR